MNQLEENPEEVEPPVLAPTRPFYWSIRRELWEHRSILMAPLVISALVLFASLIHQLGLPDRVEALPTLTPAKQHSELVRPFSLAPAPIMLASFLIGFFYCLDALHGERRDRSILFWKSLPVSDRLTVLAKASIPLVVLPLYTFLLCVATVVMLLLASVGILLVSGVSPAPLFAEIFLLERVMVMFYGLAVHTLWFAPIYGWVLLVSVWSRRLPLLWAVLPPAAVMIVERLAFTSSHLWSLLSYRVNGAMAEAFDLGSPEGKTHGISDRVWQLDWQRFLGSPGLWSGLLFAAICLALAIRLRRRQENT